MDYLIYITRGAAKKYRNVNVAGNGEVLSPSQSFTTRIAAIKNILAHMTLFNSEKVMVQDDTKTVPERYYLLPTGHTVPLKAGPKYKKK